MLKTTLFWKRFSQSQGSSEEKQSDIAWCLRWKKGDWRAKSLVYFLCSLLFYGDNSFTRCLLACAEYGLCKVPCSSGDGWDVCVYPALFAARDLISYTWLEMWLHRGQSSAFSGMHFLDAHFKLHGLPWKLSRGKQLVKTHPVLVSTACQINFVFLLY